ncbi:metallophosphoesterase family protein [Bacillus sp. WLY-B-L8]|uniref:metallophosphoesterase family protein n=1 Tax=Bacillus multifaciens TaxID=3068506 RepID=UPI00274055F2|nr:metallophosphoesterase [Bacillus sp. WLY-B-L8]MDP7977406.1 metallophosphoesterase [Bacillus sp. WLY-B-L8]
MKALIVSDSHGSVKELKQLKEQYEGNVDVMIHCGDSELTSQHTELEGFHVVKGNCDYAGDFPNDIITEVQNTWFLITHGHLYNIKMTLQTLLYRAKEAEANVVCFGHSHILGAEIINDILFINPGSILLPRSRREKTFALLEIKEDIMDIRFLTLEGTIVAQKTLKIG